MNEKVPHVEIKQALGLTPAEVKEKKHNIWVGISMSNKKFTPENIKALILWALENTKEKVLVWIPGRMQATNYYYFDKFSRADALKRAFDEEGRFKGVAQEILGNLSEEERSKISVVSYDEICTPNHMRQSDVFFREFAEKNSFYDAVMRVTEDIFIARGRTIEDKKVEAVALYILQELPLFVGGVQTLNGEDVYTLVPYPGFGKIDQLAMDIVEGEKFPELTKQLKLENGVGILDVEFV